MPARSVFSQGMCANHTVFSLCIFRVNNDVPAIPLFVNVFGMLQLLLPSLLFLDLVCPSIVRCLSQSLRFVVEDCFNKLIIFTYILYVNGCAKH